jgi:hypothetical protein
MSVSTENNYAKLKDKTYILSLSTLYSRFGSKCYAAKISLHIKSKSRLIQEAKVGIHKAFT